MIKSSGPWPRKGGTTQENVIRKHRMITLNEYLPYLNGCSMIQAGGSEPAIGKYVSESELEIQAASEHCY